MDSSNYNKLNQQQIFPRGKKNTTTLSPYNQLFRYAIKNYKQYRKFAKYYTLPIENPANLLKAELLPSFSKKSSLTLHVNAMLGLE